MGEESQLGRVTWHSSGEDEGPDVGLCLGLGDGRSLWLGELPKTTLTEAGVDLTHYPDGWWLAVYTGDGVEVVGAVSDNDAARDLFDRLAGAVRHG